LLLCLAARTSVQAQADTIPRENLLTWRDAAIIERFPLRAVPWAPLDRKFAKAITDSSLQANRRLHTVATFVRTVADPGAFVIGAGMYAYGRIAKQPKAADLGLHGTEALLVGEALGGIFKGIVGRARPLNDIDNPH